MRCKVAERQNGTLVLSEQEVESLRGAVDAGMKQAVLTRALEQFPNFGDMFPQAGGWEKPPVFSEDVDSISGAEETLTGIPTVADDGESGGSAV